jgi:alkylation response protein AidB-like acyl-CoA dehydrogenase
MKVRAGIPIIDTGYQGAAPLAMRPIDPFYNSDYRNFITLKIMARESDMGASAGRENERASDLLIGRALEMVPILRGRDAEAERNRMVQAETIADYRRDGFFKILQPKRFGGVGGDLDDYVRLSIVLARGSGAAAWIFANVGLHSWQIAMFAPQAQEDIWGKDLDTITSSCLRPAGKTERVEGGFLLSGHWSYVSGVDHTAWTLLGGIADVGGGKPEPCYFLVPREDYRLLDNWQVMGLAGTGSKDILAEKVFVPAHRVLSAREANSSNPPGAALHDHPIYRVPMFSSFAFFVCTPLVGMAQGMLANFIEHARGRQTFGGATGGGDAMANLTTIQLRVGECAMKADAAAAMLELAARESMDMARSGGAFTTDQRMRNRRAQAFAARQSVEIANDLFETVGAGGVFLSEDTQRSWRDIHAGAKHFSLNWDAVRVMTGEYALGLDPKLRMF